MSSESNKALVRRFFDDVCNGRKPAVAHEIFAQEFVYHEPPSISPGGTGPEAMAQEAARYYQAMSNAQWVVHDALAGENNTVMVRWTGQGTHDGNLAGIPPTSKQVSVEALTLFRLEGDKIVEMWDCLDALGLLRTNRRGSHNGISTSLATPRPSSVGAFVLSPSRMPDV